MNTTKVSPFSLGSEFEKGYCDVYAYFPDGEKFAALRPLDVICPESPSKKVDESILMVMIMLYFGLAMLVVAALRLYFRPIDNKLNNYKNEWHYLIALYILATIAVPLSTDLGPPQTGFNRIISFGVFIHNSAELYLILSVWLGRQSTKTKNPLKIVYLAEVSYLFIMVFLTAILDLQMLFFIGALQGASMDWMTSATFFIIFKKYKNKQNRTRYFGIAFGASLLHVISVQPLFFGFSLAWGALTAFSVLLVLPTFVLYLFFSVLVSDHEQEMLLGIEPSYGSYDHSTLVPDTSANVENENSKQNANENGNIMANNNDEMNEQQIVSSNSNIEMDGMNEHQSGTHGTHTNSVKLNDSNGIKSRSKGNVPPPLKIQLTQAALTEAQMDVDLKVELLILNKGLYDSNKREFTIAALCSFTAALIDMFIVALLPCWVDMSFVCE